MTSTPGEPIQVDEDDQEQVADHVANADAPESPKQDGDLSDEAIAAMPEADVLKHIRSELLKDLLRCLRDGTATHQEKAIARGLLRDNKMGLDGEDDEIPPGPGGRKLPERNQAFPDYGGTEGG